MLSTVNHAYRLALLLNAGVLAGCDGGQATSSSGTSTASSTSSHVPTIEEICNRSVGEGSSAAKTKCLENAQKQKDEEGPELYACNAPCRMMSDQQAIIKCLGKCALTDYAKPKGSK